MDAHLSWPIMRPLPRPVSPAQDETLRSYLGRLARANRLDADALRTHLTGTKARYTSVEVDALARISGQSTRSLRYAVLELCTGEELAAMRIAGRPPPHGQSQLRCILCTLGRGHQGQVWGWNHPEDVICQKHRRWIGTDEHTAHHQPSLTDQPQILQAGEQHRRMIRRYGRPIITNAFEHATQICHHWHRRLEHDDDFYRLMERFHHGQWRVTPTDPTVHAARYPQIIALTRLLASPRWPNQTRWPPPEQFIHELRRTVAPNFQWTHTGQGGTRDPLITHLRNQRDRPDETQNTCLSNVRQTQSSLRA